MANGRVKIKTELPLFCSEWPFSVRPWLRNTFHRFSVLQEKPAEEWQSTRGCSICNIGSDSHFLYGTTETCRTKRWGGTKLCNSVTTCVPTLSRFHTPFQNSLSLWLSKSQNRSAWPWNKKKLKLINVTDVKKRCTSSSIRKKNVNNNSRSTSHG